MRKPWSISTTVRNPERLKDFLRVLLEFENVEFDEKTQIEYQIKLIQHKLYIPNKISRDVKEGLINNPEVKELPYDVARGIFFSQQYTDPPMRGRQSVNPLNKLGFSIARKEFGKVRITELGKIFLNNEHSLSEVFLKSFLKLQFPNPWSNDFSYEKGFNIIPFVSTIKFLDLINKETNNGGIDRTEFCIFIPTLINYKDIDRYVELLFKYRESKDKYRFLMIFLKDFYQIEDESILFSKRKMINNLFDYGDNILRYFRLTNFFTIEYNNYGNVYLINLSKNRETEIKFILQQFTGEANIFEKVEEYIDFLSDINRPQIPWFEKSALAQIAVSLKNEIIELVEEHNLNILNQNYFDLNINLQDISLNQINLYIEKLRDIKINVLEEIKKLNIKYNLNALESFLEILSNKKYLKEIEPEKFEEIIYKILLIINDQLEIRGNFLRDDNGNVIFHAPAGKADIEYYYKLFNGICEVSLLSNQYQWIQEGYPVLRHVKDFINKTKNDCEKDIINIFIAPTIHDNTYYQFFIANKFGFEGEKLKIIPLSIMQFVHLLKVEIKLMRMHRCIKNDDIYLLYSTIIKKINDIDSHNYIENVIDEEIFNFERRLLGDI